MLLKLKMVTYIEEYENVHRKHLKTEVFHIFAVFIFNQLLIYNCLEFLYYKSSFPISSGLNGQII